MGSYVVRKLEAMPIHAFPLVSPLALPKPPTQTNPESGKKKRSSQMERGDSINMGIPGPNINSSASMLGLDMQLSSHAHHPSHLQFHPHDPTSQPHHGPIRHHHSSSPSPSPSHYSPYGASIARARQVAPITQHVPEAEDSDVGSKRPGVGPGSQQACPWGRMKWTEGMVRLLIAEVYRVGDDGGGGTDGVDHHAAPGKGANRPGGAAKGKWKSVSKAMMDKGYSVSPQQCEDKFNDLNKRYKRVIDLLGKGTACRVVENPNLLDSMELSAKAKEEARKLLSSKHLFFPEMCAYHNAGAQPCTGASSQHPSNSQANVQSDQQQCMHHQPTGGAEPARYQQANHPNHSGPAAGTSDEEDDNNMSDNESNDSSNKEGGYDGDYYQGGGDKKHRNVNHATHSPPLSLSLSSTSGGSTAVQQLKSELAGVVAIGGDGVKQWMKQRSGELEEQRVRYQCRAYQLEKQRFKWLRYSTNKEREMEKMRLTNDRLRLENERMLLLIRQKEIELYRIENAGTGAPAASSTEQLQLQQQQYIQK